MTANNVRGIEHVGITVPDIQEGERFFRDAFGATVLYRLVPRDADDVPGSDVHAANGLPKENAMRAVTMMRLGNGANIELFQMAQPSRDQAPLLSDLGINHFSICVEDIEAAANAAERAGATKLDGPMDAFAQEAGEGNRIWFVKSPWGGLIELLSLPSDMTYDSNATQKRLIPLPR